MGCVNGTTRSDADAETYYQDEDRLMVVNEDGQRCSKDDVQQVKKRNKIKNININSSEQSSTDERNKKGKKKKNNNGSHSNIKNANFDDSRFVGTKLAAANEDPSPTSPTISNGGSSRKNAQNGSSKSTKNDHSENGNQKSSKDQPSLTPEKLHKNFQNRLLTAQLARNCHTTDSQAEFFRMLDEKIARGRDYCETA